jgi:hypothetical protein
MSEKFTVVIAATRCGLSPDADIDDPSTVIIKDHPLLCQQISIFTKAGFSEFVILHKEGDHKI